MAATPLASARPVAPRGVPAHAPAAAIIGGGRRAPARGFRPPPAAAPPPSRAATSSRAPAPTPPAAAAAAGSAGASSRPTTPYPLASGGEGWNAVELYALTGLVWRFTTPSSTDGRKIVKAAAERAGVSLKGSSNFRKEDWNDAAEEASIARLDTFSTLPGMRGFRACWADHGVALLYVPGVRRFYTVADVANGAADRKAEMDAASVISNIEGLFKSKPGLREQYEIATDPRGRRRRRRRISPSWRKVSCRAARRRRRRRRRRIVGRHSRVLLRVARVVVPRPSVRDREVVRRRGRRRGDAVG